MVDPANVIDPIVQVGDWVKRRGYPAQGVDEFT